MLVTLVLRPTHSISFISFPHAYRPGGWGGGEAKMGVRERGLC